MCRIITLDEEEYNPGTYGQTCTCELFATPVSKVDPDALRAFGKWVVETYMKKEQESGTYAPGIEIRMF